MFLCVSTSVVVSVGRAGAIVDRVALVGRMFTWMGWACCKGSGGSLKSNDAAISGAAYAVGEREGSTDEGLLAGKVLEDEKWVADGDASIIRGDKICNSSSGRVSEWVLDAVLVYFLERVEFLTDLSFCAHRTISKITERANRDGVCLGLSHGHIWHSKIDLEESGLFSELGKLDASSSDGIRCNQVAGGENWLGGSRFESNLGRRVLLGGAIPACGIDTSIFFFSISQPRISCLVRLWPE